MRLLFDIPVDASPAIRKVDRVMSLPGSCTIAMLLLLVKMVNSLNFSNTTRLIKTSTSVAVSNSIVVVVRNYLMDVVSISVSNSMTSMSNSMTTMSYSMTSMSACMPKTSMANARASMVTKTTRSSMSSTKATNLGGAGGQEGRDANEDLEMIFYIEWWERYLGH